MHDHHHADFLFITRLKLLNNDIQLVNLALLAKWGCRFLVGDPGFSFYLFLVERSIPSWVQRGQFRLICRWCHWKVGSASQTSFWKDSWLGIIPLKIKFSGLFSNSPQSNGMVGEIALMVNGVLIQDLRRQGPFFLVSFLFLRSSCPCFEMSLFLYIQISGFESLLERVLFQWPPSYLVQRVSSISSLVLFRKRYVFSLLFGSVELILRSWSFISMSKSIRSS